MDYRMNSKMLESWLSLKEYTMPIIRMTKEEVLDSEYQKMEQNNRILGRSFHHTFEKWFRQWKRIPTPQEFVAMQMQDIRRNYSNEGWKRRYKINFKLTPIVEKGIKQRLLRSYKSFINELHTELCIKQLYPYVNIVRSDELDFSGIDIFVQDRKHGIEHKIHITKNSEYAIDFLFKKEGKELDFERKEGSLFAKPTWKKSTHSIYKDRSFKGHTFFLYNEVNSSDIRMVNGYPLFTLSYINRKMEADRIRLKKVV